MNSSPIARRPTSRLRESAISAAVFAAGAIRPFMETMNPQPPPTRLVVAYLGVLLVGAAVIPLRHRHPTVALAAATASSTLLVVTGLNWIGSLLPVGVCLYTVCLTMPRIAALIRTLCAIGLVVAASALSWRGSGGTDPVVIPVLATLVAVAAFGRNANARKRYVAATVQRAEAIRQNAEHEVRRRFAERQLSMARELHDTVAHHMTIINVQASVAADSIDREPALATQAVGHCKQAAQQALAELYTILRVLRDPDDDPELHPHQKTGAAESGVRGGQAPVERLVADQRARGDFITVEGLELLEGLAAPIGGVVYPVVQEALTNWHKHALGSEARITVDRAGTFVRLEVTNGPGRAATDGPVTGSGSGLTGIRSRLAQVGGSASWGEATDGGFRLTILLPSGHQGDPQKDA